MYKKLSHKHKIISLITILLCIFVGVGVYAGVQSEVGTYLWDISTSRWIKAAGINGVPVAAGQSGTSVYAIKKTDVGTVSTNIAFGFTSKKLIIETDSANTDDICIDWIGGTAACPAANTAGDDRIAAGRLIVLDDYAQTSIKIIAASGTQTISIRAFN